MSAYILAIYDIVDPESYQPYVPGVVPLLEKHGAEILVAEYEDVKKIRINSSKNGKVVLAKPFAPA